MKRVDAWILVLAGIALAGSTVGIFVYEEAGVPENPKFQVTWSETETELTAEEKTGPSADFAFDVGQDNITRIVFRIETSGSGPRAQPVTVHVDVSGPGGLRAQDEARYPAPSQGSSSADFDIPFDLAVVPEEETIEADSQSSASQNVTERHGSDVGKGRWKVTVTFTPGVPAIGETFTSRAQPTFSSYAAEITLQAVDVQQR